MFDQISGLPVHILVIHAAVVFVPLLALGAIVYAVVPRFRGKIGWAVLALAVVAPIVTFVSRQSGQQLYNRVVTADTPAAFKAKLDAHMSYGSSLFLFVLALGIVTLVLVLLTSRKSGSLPKIADIGLGVVAIVLALLSAYYVFKTGDSGAHAVWGRG